MGHHDKKSKHSKHGKHKNKSHKESKHSGHSGQASSSSTFYDMTTGGYNPAVPPGGYTHAGVSIQAYQRLSRDEAAANSPTGVVSFTPFTGTPAGNDPNAAYRAVDPQTTYGAYGAYSQSSYNPVPPQTGYSSSNYVSQRGYGTGAAAGQAPGQYYQYGGYSQSNNNYSQGGYNSAGDYSQGGYPGQGSG